MPLLEILYCDNGSYDDAYELAMTDIVLAAAKHSTLKCLKFVIGNVGSDLDKALAECIRTNTKITKIKLDCRPRSGTSVRLTLPAVEEALKTNYRVRTIDLKPTRQWDAGLQSRIQTTLQLNEAGRKYVRKDANNKRAAIRVLSRVNQSQDCLFVHLRENPTICGGMARPTN
jgi:hypothetical protein